LLFTYNEARSKAMLAHGAADWTREHTRLQRGDPQIPVELGTPRFLIRLNEQAERPATDLIARQGLGPRAPLRKVVGDPEALVKERPIETVLHFQFVAGPIKTHNCHAGALRLSSLDRLSGNAARFMKSP